MKDKSISVLWCLAVFYGCQRHDDNSRVYYLSGKLSELSSVHPYKGHQPAWREQLTSALVSLGFSPKESDGAISQVISNLQADGADAAQLDLSELLKLTLASGKSARG
jgi:Holliday junction DNA helicase RuvA